MTLQNELDNSNTPYTSIHKYYKTFHFHICSTCNDYYDNYILFLKRDPKGFGLICPKCEQYINLFLLLGSYIQDKRYALEVVTLYIYKLISYDEKQSYFALPVAPRGGRGHPAPGHPRHCGERLRFPVR